MTELERSLPRRCLDEIGCADPEVCFQVCNSRNGCNDIAYPLLVIRLMPNGKRSATILPSSVRQWFLAIRGLTLACMIAALMSSLTSIFNSSSTIFTIDIWQRFRRNAPDWELMIVGRWELVWPDVALNRKKRSSPLFSRVFVLILVGISILWIPIIRAAQGSRLFDYIQAVQSFLAPPVAACYLLAVLWKRINEEVILPGLKSKGRIHSRSSSGRLLGFDRGSFRWDGPIYLGIFLHCYALPAGTLGSTTFDHPIQFPLLFNRSLLHFSDCHRGGQSTDKAYSREIRKWKGVQLSLWPMEVLDLSFDRVRSGQPGKAEGNSNSTRLHA